MLSPSSERQRAEGNLDSAIDPRIKPLLDHVASELARECIQLMEIASTAEADGTLELGTEGEQK